MMMMMMMMKTSHHLCSKYGYKKQNKHIYSAAKPSLAHVIAIMAFCSKLTWLPMWPLPRHPKKKRLCLFHDNESKVSFSHLSVFKQIHFLTFQLISSMFFHWQNPGQVLQSQCFMIVNFGYTHLVLLLLDAWIQQSKPSHISLILLTHR